MIERLTTSGLQHCLASYDSDNTAGKVVLVSELDLIRIEANLHALEHYIVDTLNISEWKEVPTCADEIKKLEEELVELRQWYNDNIDPNTEPG